MDQQNFKFCLILNCCDPLFSCRIWTYCVWHPTFRELTHFLTLTVKTEKCELYCLAFHSARDSILSRELQIRIWTESRWMNSWRWTLLIVMYSKYILFNINMLSKYYCLLFCVRNLYVLSLQRNEIPVSGLIHTDKYQIEKFDNGHFRINFIPHSGRLIESRKAVFQDVIVNGDVKHAYIRRGQYRPSDDPNRKEVSDNVDLLNNTAKNILFRMYWLLAPSTSRPESTSFDSKAHSKSFCEQPCLNDGICQAVNDSGGKCVCLSGYRGKYCQYQDQCSSSPGCGPHEECVQDGETFRCRCRSGFVKKLNRCVGKLSPPLVPRGSILDIQTSVSLWQIINNCLLCFFLKKTAKEGCQNVACKNGGKCIPFVLKTHNLEKSFCRCKLGFRGKFCEEGMYSHYLAHKQANFPDFHYWPNLF